MIGNLNSSKYTHKYSALRIMDDFNKMMEKKPILNVEASA